MRQKGFTLIEILVVIAIIGILAMIVFVNLTNSRAKARDARRVADMHTIQNALELYFNDCGQYPATWSLTENTGCTAPTTLSTYLGVLPVNPGPEGSAYTYAYDSTENTYTVTFTTALQVSGLAPGLHTLKPDGIH
jgi:type II secretion system protein G